MAGKSRGTYRGLGTGNNSSLELALKYHITAIRYGKHHQILAVKHIQGGWMTLDKYYARQKLHELMPIFEKITEGGYRLKQAIWNQSVDVTIAGTGASLPMGVVLVGLATTFYAQDIGSSPANAAFDIACLVIPFGDIYLLWRGALTFGSLLGSWSSFFVNSVKQVPVTPSQPPTTDSSGNLSCAPGYVLMYGSAYNPGSAAYVCVAQKDVGVWAILGFVSAVSSTPVEVFVNPTNLVGCPDGYVNMNRVKSDQSTQPQTIFVCVLKAYVAQMQANGWSVS